MHSSPFFAVSLVTEDIVGSDALEFCLQLAGKTSQPFDADVLHHQAFEQCMQQSPLPQQGTGAQRSEWPDWLW